uniref:Uncharacterized protein n=1 Tax=Candidatus Nitrotoga fabula TaxID=2182327 RepID=A0A2X0R4W2_9PROT|nr:protein of unknown function [Candidatus Nitrotoga fabula]
MFLKIQYSLIPLCLNIKPAKKFGDVVQFNVQTTEVAMSCLCGIAQNE